MRYRFQFRRYRVPFRAPVRTAHGLWTEREGVIVRVTRAEGSRGLGDGRADPDQSAIRNPESAIGYGEAAPIPWFGTETVDEIEAAAREIGEWVEAERLAEVPARLGCLRHAIAGALPGKPENGDRKPETTEAERVEYLGVAGLLPAGRAALGQIAAKAELGFRVFKWKVGVGDIADELALLDDVCAALPDKAVLRLDANGAWDRRKAERWLERCAERPVEFVEQPCWAAPGEGESARRKGEDVLLGLAGDFPTPLALDESLVGDGDVGRWIAAGWPGVYVVKPPLLGDVAGALAQLKKAKADVVFSSALETVVGARAALRTAFAWAEAEAGASGAASGTGGDAANGTGQRVRRALGFGVWPLFADPRFDGPGVAPFIRRRDVERMDASVEAAWEAVG